MYTGMEFYQPVELVESLCEIREFYIEAEKKLRLELHGSKPEVIHRRRFCFRLYPKGERHNEGRTGAAYSRG